VEADFCNRVLHAQRQVTDGNNLAFAGHHQDKLSVDTLVFPSEGGFAGQGM
jgi:hypothetical protein